MSQAFTRSSTGEAMLGGVPLRSLLTNPQITSPAYVYALDPMIDVVESLHQGYQDRKHLICFAVKANTAGRIVQRFAEHGVGADVVSGGELAVAVGSGVPAEKIVWSGVAKTDYELDIAIKTGPKGILAIQIESVEEISRIEKRAAALNKTARVSIRLNPSVEAETHAHIATGHDEAKFGVALSELPTALSKIKESPHLKLMGLSCHIGSQLTSVTEYQEAAKKLSAIVADYRKNGYSFEYIDFGGGFGIDYGQGCPVSPADFAKVACEETKAAGIDDLMILCEPGRALVAPFAVLLARVIQPKQWQTADGVRRWLFIDAGMNDLMRPALYQAKHRIEPLSQNKNDPQVEWRVAGPVCESTDDFGQYILPASPPDAVVIRDVGAYGYTMASEYNGRALPCEVFIENETVSIIQRGEGVEGWVKRRLYSTT